MNRIATTVGLVFVLAQGGLLSSEVEDAKSDVKQIQLVLDFRGLVAFLPQGAGSDGYEVGKPMGDQGAVETMVVLLPRADDASLFNSSEIPAPIDFAHHGHAHERHFAALRIPLSNLGATGPGSALLPLKGKAGDTTRATYRIQLKSTKDVVAKVSFEDMDEVAPVIEGAPSKIQNAVPGPVNPSAARTAFVATLVLKNGEQLQASEDPSITGTTWEYKYERCVGGGSSPGVSCTHYQVPEKDYDWHYDHLASQATATRAVPADAKVTLEVTEYVDGSLTNTTVLPLTPSRGKVEVRVENGPASELVTGQSGGEEHQAYEHFKLYDLLAFEQYGTYYFPEMLVTRVDPYCTPLAQFVQRK